MSMGAPACDVTPRTEGFLWGKGGSRGRGGSEIHSLPQRPGTGRCLPLVSPATLHGASQPVTCSKRPQELDRLCGP